MRKLLLIFSLILSTTLGYSQPVNSLIILQAPGFFGISQILIYGGGIIIIVVTIFMALGRKKRYDDEDITD